MCVRASELARYCNTRVVQSACDVCVSVRACELARYCSQCVMCVRHRQSARVRVLIPLVLVQKHRDTVKSTCDMEICPIILRRPVRLSL